MRHAVDAVNVLGVRIDDVTFDETLAQITRFIAERTPRQIATVNTEFIMAAQKDAAFRAVLNACALNLPDAAGVVWAARKMGKPVRMRVPGVDMVERIAERASRDGWKLFLLGAAEGVAQKTADVFASRYHNVQCVGVLSGSPREEDEAQIIAAVRAATPDVLFVAFGAPAQNMWIARNLSKLDAPVCIGVGGAFDFIAGVTRRAPLWMRRLNLEWLHRLLSQPWRWRRMLVLPMFAWRVWRESRAVPRDRRPS
jgi:N-acetylglucosaminyldiphosphoundecaprenol N-acetyl-beta-D-mannosaminyltransferase